ncbi:unnamed protein product [Larinioides sclopetarius]|uniref:Uncharacterized protein n=1 Tax=Larinioides sclopetarius TaxID=280406 RepID=A0AAV1Z5R6_9ARAC
MKEAANDVVDKLQNLTVKDDEVEEEFKKDFGSRLRLVKGALLIQEIGNQLHCSIISIAKAQVLFHQFQRLKKNAFNTVWLAASCLNLSIKLCEEDVKLDEVILKFYHAAQDLKSTLNPDRPDPSSEELRQMRRNLSLVQYSICGVMAFKVQCKIAHTYLYKFLAQLHSLSDVSEVVIISMSSTATKLLSTYYLCEGCLDFNADEIAIACLQFTFLYCGVVVPSVKYLMKRVKQL